MPLCGGCWRKKDKRRNLRANGNASDAKPAVVASASTLASTGMQLAPTTVNASVVNAGNAAKVVAVSAISSMVTIPKKEGIPIFRIIEYVFESINFNI